MLSDKQYLLASDFDQLVQQGGEPVNRREGLTIAVSENKYITQIAKRTILSDDALSVLIPVLEDVAEWPSSKIRALFETDSLPIAKTSSPQAASA